MSWKHNMMTSYLLSISLFTNEIQALQQWLEKYIDRKRDTVEKWTYFDHIPWEYLGQLRKFSADLLITLSPSPNACGYFLSLKTPCLKSWAQKMEIIMTENKMIMLIYTTANEDDRPIFFLNSLSCQVCWGWRIHWLHLCRGERPTLTSVLDMTLNNLMVRLQ